MRPAQQSAGWPSAVNHPSRAKQQIATGYGTYRVVSPASSSSTSSLNAKKKGGGGGGGAATAKKGKVQVQLLETVPDIGQSGDIVFVSSAVFQNQLQRSNKARRISEEEVQQLEQEREEQEQEVIDMAVKTKGMVEEVMASLGGGDADSCGVALTMKRKAGPEGNLFGGVNPKMIFDALKEGYPEGSWDGKQVKITQLKDSDGKAVKRMDIKTTGEYTVSVALAKGVDVTFILSILAE